jgi:hypothetical protein
MEMTQIRLDDEMLRNRTINLIKIGYIREQIISFFIAENYSEEAATRIADEAFALVIDNPVELRSPFRLLDEKAGS